MDKLKELLVDRHFFITAFCVVCVLLLVGLRGVGYFHSNYLSKSQEKEALSSPVSIESSDVLSLEEGRGRLRPAQTGLN